MGKRGSILLHVLVTGALIALISATLLRMAMLRYQVTVHATNGTQERRYDEGALNLIIGAWNSVNIACANNVPNYSCAPAAAVSPGNCGCTCTPTGAAPLNYPTVTNSGGAPPCTLTIGANNDLQKSWQGW